MKSAAVGMAARLVAAWTFSVCASSHREAPLISQDPLADNTDVYAFVSPRNPDRVTLLADFPAHRGMGVGADFRRPGRIW